jgi:hypothetical protein
MIIAQGKLAEAAALGSGHPMSILASLLVCRIVSRAGAANQQKGKAILGP